MPVEGERIFSKEAEKDVRTTGTFQVLSSAAFTKNPNLRDIFRHLEELVMVKTVP